MSTLTLNVMGGLCSRMRAVLPAIGFCELTNRKLVINWPRVERNLKLGFPCRLDSMWSGPFEMIDRGVVYSHDEATLEAKGDLHCRTCHPQFFPLDKLDNPPSKYISRMRPGERLGKEIVHLQWLVTNNYPCVGVIVRGSVPHPDFSPVAWHIQRMRELLALRGDLRFFAYCDLKSDLDVLRAEFGDSVFAQCRTHAYDKEGIIKQAAALYGFGYCAGLIGQNHSSFSEMSAWMLGCTRADDFKPAGAYMDSWNELDPQDFLSRCDLPSV